MRRNCIIAIGGAEDKSKRRQLLSRFVEFAGGKDARIAIISTASEDPEVRGEQYRQLFYDIGVAAVSPLPVETRTMANDPDTALLVSQATGVFLVGGNQLRISSILGGTRLANAIHACLEGGGTYCGTSAGAAAVSTHMISEGRSGIAVSRKMVSIVPGLGLITKLIVDQHFTQRERLGRLLTALAYNPNLLGVGIDEDTAIICDRNETVEVMGSGQVTILDATAMDYSSMFDRPRTKPFSMGPIALHVLAEGDGFDIASRTAIPAPARPERAARALALRA